ncbi:MAG: hypothetical protein IT378_16205 [Sandaracinaceae bacterium]|nr:hypothetical protein [Sandaracinaceae bacterium]
MEKFADVMRDAILALPQDMKAMLRIAEDPDLEDEQRAMVAGALLHVLSGANAIPGLRGMLAYVDDVIVLRLVLERLERDAPDVIAPHRASSPELLEPLASQLASIRAFLGESLSVLEKQIDGLSKLSHQGHSAQQCAHDEEAGTWLYDAVHEALVNELDFDEDEVARAVKGVDQIPAALSQRLS